MQSLSDQITAAVTQYTAAVQKDIAQALAAVGNEAKNRVAAASPKGRRGKYRRGWKVQTAERNGEISVTVHNTQYWLTHLLENGHKTRYKHGTYGTKHTAAGREHIAPVEQWAEQAALEAVRKAVQG